MPTGHPPPPTPPGYSELARDVERLVESAAQAKRDAARFYVLEDRNAQRFDRILQRMDTTDHRLLEMEKLLVILVEQGRQP